MNYIFNLPTKTECLLLFFLLLQLMLILLTIRYVSVFLGVALVVSFIAFLVGVPIMILHRMAVRKESQGHQRRENALMRISDTASLENAELRYGRWSFLLRIKDWDALLEASRADGEGVQMEENFIAL